MRTLFRLLLMALLVWGLRGDLGSAQSTGSLGGKVTDESGAGIPAAVVHAVELGSGQRQVVATNKNGIYRIQRLRPGLYRVEAERPGFRSRYRNSFEIVSGKQSQLDFVLGVCALSGDAAKNCQPVEDSTIRNFFRLNEQICTGGQPTMEELEKLKAGGTKAIINLRQASEFNAEEEAAKAKELGLRYFHIPFDSSNPKDEAVAEFLKVMDDKANRPVFIHCASANRVGAFWLIRRVLVDGWSVEKAEEETKQVGLRNPALREFALGYIERHRKKPAS